MGEAGHRRIVQVRTAVEEKKYATVSIAKIGEKIECNQELKSFDVIRRSWSRLTVITGTVTLNEILSNKPIDERIDDPIS